MKKSACMTLNLNLTDMKCYFGNHQYRGRYFDVKIHAKSRVKAAELWERITGNNIGVSHLRNYFHTNASDEKEPMIMVEPYGYSARILFPTHTGWIRVEEAMKVVDAECQRVENAWK